MWAAVRKLRLLWHGGTIMPPLFEAGWSISTERSYSVCIFTRCEEGKEGGRSGTRRQKSHACLSPPPPLSPTTLKTKGWQKERKISKQNGQNKQEQMYKKETLPPKENAEERIERKRSRQSRPLSSSPLPRLVVREERQADRQLHPQFLEEQQLKARGVGDVRHLLWVGGLRGGGQWAAIVGEGPPSTKITLRTCFMKVGNASTR